MHPFKIHISNLDGFFLSAKQTGSPVLQFERFTELITKEQICVGVTYHVKHVGSFVQFSVSFFLRVCLFVCLICLTVGFAIECSFGSAGCHLWFYVVGFLFLTTLPILT